MVFSELKVAPVLLVYARSVCYFMDLGELLNFDSLLPSDVQLLAPTVYAKLNLLNYCQYLKLFMHLQEPTNRCEHADAIQAKVDAVREIIAKIVETDKVIVGTQRFV